jgi:LysM repeat protein
MRRSFVALALALALPLPALAGEVTVQPGETLSEIADRLGISTSRLMELNSIRKADHVEAGQTLRVPGAGPAKGGQGGSIASGRITVQEGDTLSEIADRQGMTLGQLMALNGLSKADHVEVGQVLKVSGRASGAGASSAAPSYRKGASMHVVRSGESLSEIAEGYGVPMGRLVAINGIEDPNHVEVGSRLKLKGEAPPASPPRTVAVAAPRPRPAATPVATPMAKPEATVAVTPQPVTIATPRPRIETSTALPTTTPAVTRATVAATSLASATPATPARAEIPAQVSPRASTPVAAPAPSRSTTPVAAARPAPSRSSAPVATASPAPAARAASAASPAPAVATSNWRPYGPLQVDWSNWQPMGGSLVAPILNGKGETLYLAINCSARKMNATSAAGDWRTWDDPQADFERRLVNDLCSSRG